MALMTLSTRRKEGTSPPRLQHGITPFGAMRTDLEQLG